GTSGNDAISATGNAASPTVQVGAFKAVTLVAATTESLVIAAGNGNDALTVDSSANRFPIPLVYDGGAGTDSLPLTGGTARSRTYTPGPTAGSGTSTIVFTSGAGGTQTVSFQNLEPMIDLVSGPLVVNGTNANNAINYTQGPNSGAALVGGATTGQVSVD